MISGGGARTGMVIVLVVGAGACGAAGRTPVVSNAGPPAADAAGLAKRADERLARSVALDYARPFRGPPRDLAPVIAAYLDACRAGDGVSCRRAMALANQAGDGAGLRALIERCRGGELDSCRALPADAAIADDHALPGWAGRSATCKQTGCDVELRRECTAGFAASCFRLAGHDAPDDDALFARARELARAGCRADLGPACQLLGELRETDDDDLLRHGYACRLRGVDCTAYGLDLHNEPTAARDVFERACQYSAVDQVNACRVLVESYADHRIPEPMPGRARAVHDWVCARPNPWPELCARPVGPLPTDRAPQR